jgi:uncharacterized membrane protein (UPF0127 family)
MRLCRLVVLLAFMLPGCGRKEEVTAEIVTKTLSFPSGKVIRVEVMMRPQDIMRGMMFRDAFPPDRGMLFVHNRPSRYSYWMYNVKVPLDIIWMDKDKRIVEISENSPPCQEAQPVKCPQFGGKADSRFVLELNAGAVKQFGLAVGQNLTF